MSREPRRLRRDTLAGDIDHVVRQVLLLVFVVLLTAAIGVVSSEHLRQQVLTRGRPALTANDHLMQDLLQAQSALRAYVASGDERFFTGVPDRAAIRADQTALTLLAGADAATERQDDAIDQWWGFRDELVRLRASGGNAAARLAATPFGQVQAANHNLDARLNARVAHTTLLTSRVLLGTGILHVAEAALLAALVVRLRRRLRDDLLVPLEDLRETIDDDDPTRRAVEGRGHGEVRELARVVNGHRDQVVRADAENAATVARLESLDRQKTDFMATVSHELRTPLTSIAGYVEMLQDGDYGEATAEQSAALDVVARNTHRLRQLIEELLVLSRIDTAGVQLHRREASLVALARQVVENLGPQAMRGRVELRLEPGAELPPTHGDPDQLERALTNVIANAVKFTPPGGRVHVAVSASGGGQVVRVADTGIGIPEADLVDVGRRFFRAANVTDQSIPGTGLGLSIVRAIMASHGGSCEVSSRVGHGTTVTLSLPQEVATQPE